MNTNNFSLLHSEKSKLCSRVSLSECNRVYQLLSRVLAILIAKVLKYGKCSKTLNTFLHSQIK